MAGYSRNVRHWQSMTACDNSDNCSCNGAYEGVNGVPYMVDEGNLVGDKVEECEYDKRGDEPALGDKGEVRAHREQMQPAYRESESEQGQVCIQAGGECEAEGCTKSDDIHEIFLLVCMFTLP